MPYNPAVTRELLRIAGAFESNPLGEFTQKLSAQLIESENEIRAANSRAATAEAARNKAEAELETATATIHRIRNGSVGMNDLIDTLTAISLNPKGAKKVADAALFKLKGGAS